ncbi:MAG TPA: tRNA-dihydrouridine synthase [Burkholderiales bacterium]|nr:tRNA-dihydrouridine synthase [Burkholderiales bacterium]
MSLSIRVGKVELKNPLICGSGEHVISSRGVRAALAAGAGAVSAKSTNESEAAKRQLDGTDYALFDARWNRLPWDFNPPPDAQLFCRSGLIQEPFDAWLERIAALDREARSQDAYVLANLILADLDQCARMAKAVEQAGLRVLVLNVGAPHGGEATPGAIVLEKSSDRVRKIVERIRKTVSIPLWVKLTGQSEDVAALAQAAKEGGADAVIVMGRFMALVPDVETRAPALGTVGAIGGPWALAITSRWLAITRQRVGRDFPLIATNGARSGLDIARFLLAGASAVEMSSAIMAGGSAAISDALLELKDYLKKNGVTAESLVGEAADKLETYQQQASRPGHWKKFVPPEML